MTESIKTLPRKNTKTTSVHSMKKNNKIYPDCSIDKKHRTKDRDEVLV